MQKKHKTSARKIIIVTSIILLLWILGFYLYVTYNNIEIYDSNYTATKTLSTKEEQTVEKVEENSKKVSDIIEETVDCVVGISKLKNTGTSIFTESTESQLGLGTGIIVTENGYVLSNEHVTGSKYSKCYVTLDNGKNYEGKVVWSDSNLDLSILKINENNLKYISLGDSDNIKIGETVYAIGNPIGFEFRRTVTSGIISAKNRTIKIEEENNSYYMTNLIQTDATINPGNSGGPLIYPNGQVIGINTVKISTAEGIGFAIPINIVKPIIEKYKNTDEFEEAKIGIYAYDKEVIPYLENTTVNFKEGIYVVQLTKNGPADKAGVKEGDIITKIDDTNLTTMNDLRQYIYTKKPNENVTLKINRGKIKKDIVVQLGK
ncbi:MAG: S1C family serine protease [Clostridia bacterium]